MAGPTAEVSLRWRERLVFEGGGVGRPPVVVDGDGAQATSPVELLLVAGASCTGADIVGILEKMRVGLQAIDIGVTGTRRAEHPRRLTALHFRFTVRGSGVDETKVRRAVELSLDKYCSVMTSLAPDIRVSYEIAVA